MDNKIVAVVGMCGAGKTEVTETLVNRGFNKIYFGAVTFDELKKRNLPTNWENEKKIREEFRSTGDMAIYAKLNENKIKEAYDKGNVVIESLYSWSEYKYLKNIYKDNIELICVVTDKELRIERLSIREIRPMLRDDVETRDISEIENLEKGGPIAYADYFILNNGTKEELIKNTNEIIDKILSK